MCLLLEVRGLPETRTGPRSCAPARWRISTRCGGSTSPNATGVKSVLRPGRVASGGAAKDLQAQQRTFAARGGDVDSELFDHPIRGQIAYVVHGHSDQFLRGDGRRRLRDRAAVAVEAEVRDLPVLDPNVHPQLVAAERVVVVELEVAGVELPEVPRVLVVVEDVVPVEIVHRHGLRKISRR